MLPLFPTQHRAPLLVLSQRAGSFPGGNRVPKLGAGGLDHRELGPWYGIRCAICPVPCRPAVLGHLARLLGGSPVVAARVQRDLHRRANQQRAVCGVRVRCRTWRGHGMACMRTDASSEPMTPVGGENCATRRDRDRRGRAHLRSWCCWGAQEILGFGAHHARAGGDLCGAGLGNGFDGAKARRHIPAPPPHFGRETLAQSPSAIAPCPFRRTLLARLHTGRAARAARGGADRRWKWAEEPQ